MQKFTFLDATVYASNTTLTFSQTGNIVFKFIENLTFSFKNVHYLGTTITHLLDHNPATFPTITQIHCFPLFVLFHSFHSYALRMLMIVTWCTRYRIRCFPGKNETILFCRSVSFFASPNCQCRGVCQVMKQSKLYQLYPLFQDQWDRCDQQKHQANNYLVKGHYLYSGTWN